jgi:hypothetical protein
LVTEVENFVVKFLFGGKLKTKASSATCVKIPYRYINDMGILCSSTTVWRNSVVEKDALKWHEKKPLKIVGIVKE